MENTDRLAPQPDTSLLGRIFHSAGDEFEKFQNVPAIAGGERILAEIQLLRQDIAVVRQDVEVVRQDVRQDVAVLRRDVEVVRQDVAATRQDLITMMATSNHNNTARVQNSYLSSRSHHLSPFLNPSNGTVILGFPASSADIRRMNEQEIDSILQQLGQQSAPGTSLAAKERGLRAHLGLRAEVETPHKE